MSREISDELTLFSQELQRSLSPQALQELAKKVWRDTTWVCRFPKGRQEMSNDVIQYIAKQVAVPALRVYFLSVLNFKVWCDILVT